MYVLLIIGQLQNLVIKLESWHLIQGIPNKVVMTTVSKAPIPNVAIDLCHMIIPGMVANKHRIRPIIGNTYVTKATATSTIVPIIIALGCTFENTFATPILFDYNVYFNLYIQIKQMC